MIVLLKLLNSMDLGYLREVANRDYSVRLDTMKLEDFAVALHAITVKEIQTTDLPFELGYALALNKLKLLKQIYERSSTDSNAEIVNEFSEKITQMEVVLSAKEKEIHAMLVNDGNPTSRKTHLEQLLRNFTSTIQTANNLKIVLDAKFYLFKYEQMKEQYEVKPTSDNKTLLEAAKKDYEDIIKKYHLSRETIAQALSAITIFEQIHAAMTEFAGSFPGEIMGAEEMQNFVKLLLPDDKSLLKELSYLLDEVAKIDSEFLKTSIAKDLITLNIAVKHKLSEKNPERVKQAEAALQEKINNVGLMDYVIPEKKVVSEQASEQAGFIKISTRPDIARQIQQLRHNYLELQQRFMRGVKDSLIAANELEFTMQRHALAYVNTNDEKHLANMYLAYQKCCNDAAEKYLNNKVKQALKQKNIIYDEKEEKVAQEKKTEHSQSPSILSVVAIQDPVFAALLDKKRKVAELKAILNGDGPSAVKLENFHKQYTKYEPALVAHRSNSVKGFFSWLSKKVNEALNSFMKLKQTASTTSLYASAVKQGFFSVKKVAKDETPEANERHVLPRSRTK